MDHPKVGIERVIPRCIVNSAPDENEEAMGNLGLEDAEQTAERGVPVLEDTMPSSGIQKRKLEVADSDEEGETLPQPVRARKAGRSESAGFTPSSQLAPEHSQPLDDPELVAHEMLLKQ